MTVKYTEDLPGGAPASRLVFACQASAECEQEDWLQLRL